MKRKRIEFDVCRTWIIDKILLVNANADFWSIKVVQVASNILKNNGNDQFTADRLVEHEPGHNALSAVLDSVPASHVGKTRTFHDLQDAKMSYGAWPQMELWYQC